MSLILASPNLNPPEPWSAWLVMDRQEPSLTGSSLDAERLNGSPGDWPRSVPVILILPAFKLSWQRVTLPRLPAQKVRAALAGLLEEELLSDPAELHLALAPDWTAGEASDVAVCDKAWLMQQITAVRTAGHDIQRIVPEFQPGQSAQFLVGEGGLTHWVRVSPTGVQALPLTTQSSWQAISQAANDEDGSLWAEPQLVDLAERILHKRFDVLSPAQRMSLAAQSDWDLAQFDLATGASRRWHSVAQRILHRLWSSPQWQAVRWGLALLLLVQALGLQAWAWRENRRHESLRSEQAALLRQTFPQTPVVIDPLAQMQRAVRDLAQKTGAPGAGDLGVMLTILAESGAPAIGQLEFATGQITLSAWPLAEESIKPLQVSLASKGYSLQGKDSQWQIKATAP